MCQIQQTFHLAYLAYQTIELEYQKATDRAAHVLGFISLDNESLTDEQIEAICTRLDEIQAKANYSARRIAAKKQLIQAEDALIHWKLNLLPAQERQPLLDSCFGLHGQPMNTTTRHNIVKLAMRRSE